MFIFFKNRGKYNLNLIRIKLKKLMFNLLSFMLHLVTAVITTKVGKLYA